MKTNNRRSPKKSNSSTIVLSKFTRDMMGGLIDEVNVARPDTPKTPLSPGHRKSSVESVSQSSSKEENKEIK